MENMKFAVFSSDSVCYAAATVVVSHFILVHFRFACLLVFAPRNNSIAYGTEQTEDALYFVGGDGSWIPTFRYAALRRMEKFNYLYLPCHQ